MVINTVSIEQHFLTRPLSLLCWKTELVCILSRILIVLTYYKSAQSSGSSRIAKNLCENFDRAVGVFDETCAVNQIGLILEREGWTEQSRGNTVMSELFVAPQLTH